MNDSEFKRMWRHRFYKLGKAKGFEVLQEMADGQHEKPLDHDQLKEVLMDIMEGSRFQEFRRLVEKKEGEV